MRLDGLRLLLIEDNPLTQRITIEMLKNQWCADCCCWQCRAGFRDTAK
ncbi:hypothetical protein HTZ85_03055 [Escherichia coli]|nr:hypothetical protein [Escherichia coli]